MILLDLVGTWVLGRHGKFGTVVEAQGLEGLVDSPTLVVRGSGTERLIFHLPPALVDAAARAGT